MVHIRGCIAHMYVYVGHVWLFGFLENHFERVVDVLLYVAYFVSVQYAQRWLNGVNRYHLMMAGKEKLLYWSIRLR